MPIHFRLTCLFMLCLSASLRGVEVEPGKVVFTLKAPAAERVVLRGQWSKDELAMIRDEDGIWRVALKDIPVGIWEYSFAVDGLNVLDPQNPAIKPQRSPAKNILHLPANPPAAWDWQVIPHGTLHLHQYHSPALDCQREIVVYTPPGYEQENTHYPLLVLQHGSGDNQRGWTEHGKAHWILDSLLAAAKAQPMVMVMMDGHPLGMVPREDRVRRAASLEAFRQELFDVVLPLVERYYRLRPEPEKRAIAGLSMGSWQSLTVGLNALDRFAYIGSFSGATEGEAIQSALDDAAHTNARLKLLWIACGREDFLLERNEEMIRQFKAADIHHEWHLTDGAHAWPVWREYLVEFLPRLFQP
jgi:enterochelin esterase-like enzyme